MMFSCLAALAAKVNVFSIERLRRLLSNPISLVWLPLLLVPAAYAGGSPLPAPESFVPIWWGFAFYGLFYWAGWIIYGAESVLDKAVKFAPLLTVVSMLLYVPYYKFTMMALASKSDGDFSFEKLVIAMLMAYMSVFLTIAGLGFGKRLLSFESNLLRFVSDSSYWTYLIHVPLVLLIQVFLVDSNMSIWWKFLISTFSTYAVCLMTYVIFVRYTANRLDAQR